MSREHPAYPPTTGGPSNDWNTTHDTHTHYGPLPSHLESLHQYPGPIQHHHHDNHHSNLHLSSGTIDHQAIGDAFLRQEFLASSLSPTNASTVPTSPLTTGTSTNGFFSMLDTQSGATGGNGLEGSSVAGDHGEEIISAAIEEDKRRRNTAASARFRMKKKEREADLERRTRDMTDRCEELQKRISALETENRWLRELITERSRNRGRVGVRRTSPKTEKVPDKSADKSSAASAKDKLTSGLRTK